MTFQLANSNLFGSRLITYPLRTGRMVDSYLSQLRGTAHLFTCPLPVSRCFRDQLQSTLGRLLLLAFPQSTDFMLLWAQLRPRSWSTCGPRGRVKAGRVVGSNHRLPGPARPPKISHETGQVHIRANEQDVSCPPVAKQSVGAQKPAFEPDPGPESNIWIWLLPTFAFSLPSFFLIFRRTRSLNFTPSGRKLTHTPQARYLGVGYAGWLAMSRCYRCDYGLALKFPSAHFIGG